MMIIISIITICYSYYIYHYIYIYKNWIEVRTDFVSGCFVCSLKAMVEVVEALISLRLCWLFIWDPISMQQMVNGKLIKTYSHRWEMPGSHEPTCNPGRSALALSFSCVTSHMATGCSMLQLRNTMKSGTGPGWLLERRSWICIRALPLPFAFDEILLCLHTLAFACSSGVWVERNNE